MSNLKDSVMMRSIHWFRFVRTLLVWSMLGLCVPAAAQPTTTNPWTPAGSAASGRSQHTATLLPSGKVLIAGGRNFIDILASADIYDPASNTWSAASSMKTGRYFHTATLLPSGKVLVAGGVSDLGGGAVLASAELYDPTSNTWSAAGSLATAHGYHTATLLPSGKVLLAGGNSFNNAELYDPATNSWSAAGVISSAHYFSTATLLLSGKVFLAGGYTGGNFLATAEIYDPASNSWSPAASMALARGKHVATLLVSGKVFVAGGASGPGTATASAELYDPANNTWSSAGSLTTARFYASASLLPSGKVLVAGGGNSVTNAVNSVQLYDPATNSWSNIADGSNFAAGTLVGAHSYHTATLLPSGKVLVAGGNDGSYDLATAELYDPASTDTRPPPIYGVSSWTPAASLATARLGHTASMLASSKILVAGGSSGSASIASAELYDGASNTWSAAGSLNSARANHTATVLASGKVLVAGGISGSAVASCELYDPISNTWSTAGSLATARGYHTATLLPSGKVLVAGGASAFGILASAELYDPATNSWSAAGGLANIRASHTATLLYSGKVLVAGGQISGGALASAELYDPASNTWGAAGNLATARFSHSATLLPSGKVLAAGGGGNSGVLVSSEIYDSVSNSWSTAASLHDARYLHIASLLPSGRVIVAAGNTGSPPATAEIYDADSNTWARASTLAIMRASLTGTLLPSGKVLITGGSAGAGPGTPTASAELYTLDLAILDSRRPVISVTNNLLIPGDALQLTGSGFTGDSEGSGGASNNTPTNSPLLQLRRLDNDQIVWSSPAINSSRSTTSYQSAPLSSMPVGPYALTMFVGALSSTSVVITIDSTHNVLSFSSGNGSISPNATQVVKDGTTTAFILTPAANYHIASVTGTCGGTLVGNTFTTMAITADCVVVANFAINTHSLTYTAAANGTISGTSPQTVNHGASGAAVTAVPSSGYHFVQWSDASIANPRADANITANISVTASFAINTYTLAYTAAANGTISGASPQTVSFGASGTAVTAVPNTGYHFVQWSDASTTNPRTDANVTATINVTASFAINTYALTYAAGTNGILSGTPSQSVNYGASGSAVTAVPNTGYHFVQWSDASTTNPRTDTNVTADLSVTASFAINTYALTYTAGANGTISGTSPQTVNYGASGTAVTVVPDTGYHFVQWSDGSTTNPRTDTNIIGNLTVTASFAIDTHTLTYAAAANGTISGDTSQAVNYGASGTAVTASPGAGYHFVQWSDASTTNPRTDANVTADISVTASFAINLYTVTTVTGANGSITPVTQSVNYGDSASFTVTPSAGYSASVSGDTCSVGNSGGTSWTSSAIAADCVVTATFAANPTPNLTISVTDNRQYARPGKLLSYLVTVTNTGSGDAVGVSLSNTLPIQIDMSYTTWICIGAGSSAVCASNGSGGLNTSGIVIPAGRTLVWQVTAPVLLDATGDTVDYAVSASLNGTADVNAVDSDTLVIFRDGFDMLYANGASAVGLQAALVDCIADPISGDKNSHIFSLPVAAPQAPIDIVLVALGSSGTGFRVERLNVAATMRVRLVTVAQDGSERASEWALTSAGSSLALAATQAIAGSSTLLLEGAGVSLAMPSPNGAASALQCSAQVSVGGE
jgi:uncharacterized repeat protein (TIGR01451 family)